MRYLFLMDEAECQNEHALESLKTFRQNNEVVVLSLSTLASIALRRMGILYVTPDMFLSKENSPAIDKQAVELSKGWYMSVDLPLMSYRGVSVGEILEFDFYHLFIDAMRSIEIANRLIRDAYDAIYLPSFESSIGFGKIIFNSMCYQTLPAVLTSLASQKGVKIIVSKPPLNQILEMDRVPGRHGQLDFAFSITMFLLKNYRDLGILLTHPNLSRFVLSNNIDDSVVKNLRSIEGRGVKIFPNFLSTRRSKSQAGTLLKLLRSEEIIDRFDANIVCDQIHLWRPLFPLIDKMLSELIPAIFYRINWTELFVRIYRPSSLVVAEDISPLNRSMCQVFKNHGVPIVVVQHGILTGDMGGMYIMPVVGNFQAVWGEFYRQWHIKRGKSPDSQIVTGFPRHDSLFHLHPLKRSELCTRFGLNPKGNMILVATEWFQGSSSRYTIEREEEYIRLVLRSLRVYKNIQIVVKLHPSFQSENQKIVSEIAEQERAEIIIAKDSLWDLIRLSKFVIVSVSSVCVEALILGKPVISVNVSNEKDISGLVMSGLAIGARTSEEIDRAVRICMEVDEQRESGDSERMTMLSPFVFSIDGNSSHRVAELIKAVSLQNPTLRQ